MRERVFRWKPEHKLFDYSEDLVKWINSINSGFANRINYAPFEIYKKEAKSWLGSMDEIKSYYSQEARLEYAKKEFERCNSNTLYALNKYHKLKEGDVEGGGLKYIAWGCQEIILFLIDCGYNLLIGKGRQIGFSSTMGGVCCVRVNFNKNYFIKFITHSTEKGEEIFGDKIKWSFGQCPDWWRATVYNDRDNVLGLARRGDKGKRGGANSRILVSTPRVDAINGGAPNLVCVDEIGLIPLFTKMMLEGRPAMFWTNPETGELEMRRQAILWGTGGQMDKAGEVFETEWQSAKDAWVNRDFAYGFIPIFFDCYAREGMTRQHYLDEKQRYYNKKGTKLEESITKFHQHYTVCEEDMFRRSGKTIISIDKIYEHIDRIKSVKHIDREQYGYFNPVFDINSPFPEDIANALKVNYKVVGSEWVPTEGIEDKRTTTLIYKHPVKLWKNRYVKGTDPINAQTVASLFSSSVWDRVDNTVASVLNYRERDYKQVYLQSLLQSMYYDLEGMKELTEVNIGTNYLDYIEMLGKDNYIVPNIMLPPTLQTPSGDIRGINNKVNTAKNIMYKLIELLDVYGSNIWIDEFYKQLVHFIEKDIKSPSGGAMIRYQADNPRFHRDDVIFAVVYSYICSLCYADYKPEEIDVNASENKITTKYICNESTGWSMRLVRMRGDKIVGYL